MDNLLEFLGREKPDILFCQEVHNATAPDMLPNYYSLKAFECLNFPYSIFTPAGVYIDENGKAEQGNAIFSRFPLTKQPTVYMNGKYQEIEDNVEKIVRTCRALFNMLRPILRWANSIC